MKQNKCILVDNLQRPTTEETALHALNAARDIWNLHIPSAYHHIIVNPYSEDLVRLVLNQHSSDLWILDLPFPKQLFSSLLQYLRVAV